MTTQQKRRYALLGGLGLALVAFLVIRGRSGGGDAELVGVAGPAGGTSLDAGGGVGGVDSFDPTSLVDLFDTRLAATDSALEQLAVSLGDVRGNVVDLEDFLKTQGATLNEDQWAWGQAPIDPDWYPPTDPGPQGQAPTAAPGNTKAAAGTGFFWNVGGRRTFVTDRNRGAFLAELKRDGVNVQAWAWRHPQAARKVGIAVPKSDPTKKKKRRRGGASGGGARAMRVYSSTAGSSSAGSRLLAAIRRPPPSTSRTSPIRPPSTVPGLGSAIGSTVSRPPPPAPRTTPILPPSRTVRGGSTTVRVL